MGAIRVELLFNNETQLWDWSAKLGDNTMVAGAGFDTAQAALVGASLHEDIKGHPFYGVADKPTLFGQRSEPAESEAVGAEVEETEEP